MERALQAKNASDAARAQEIRSQLNALATRIEGGNLGRKRRAKLQKQCAALSAELEAVDPRVVTVSPALHPETEPNDDPRAATAVDAQTDRTVVASGSIANPGDVDVST